MKFKSLFRRGHAGPSSSSVKRLPREDNNGGHVSGSAVSNNNESSVLPAPAASDCRIDSKHKIIPLSQQKRKIRQATTIPNPCSLRKMDDSATKAPSVPEKQDGKIDLEEELDRYRSEIETLRMELGKLKKVIVLDMLFFNLCKLCCLVSHTVR